MPKKVIIVEDLFLEARNLEIMLKRAGYIVSGIAKSVAEAVQLIGRDKPDLALVDIQLKGPGSGITLSVFLREQNIGFIYISANYDQATLAEAKASQPLGFIVKPFRESDLLVTLEVANFRHHNGLEAALRKEEQLAGKLEQIIGADNPWQVKMLDIARALQGFLHFDYLAVCTNSGSKAGKLMSYLRVGFDEYQFIGLEEFCTISKVSLAEVTRIGSDDKFEKELSLFAEGAFEDLAARNGMVSLIANTFHLYALFLIPVYLEDGTYFTFAFYSRRPDAYQPEQLTLVGRLMNPLSVAMKNMLGMPSGPGTPATPAADQRRGARQRDVPEIIQGIVGKSHLLLNVFDHMEQVAPVDTSVLILGESGTGKERIAETIHHLSNRRSQPLVKINCSTLPAHLFESELFGHEKGAFTGALEKRIGKFERADKGTIFLDEIGEMPLDLQAKLLRVLQEKEIERVGGRETLKVDTRIIAATNRNLEAEVAAGRFRLDLYYRLNIFPIQMPALRERSEDIPYLIDHFIGKFNQKTGKAITGIGMDALQDAVDYAWPGNIRELENQIERAVLLAKGSEIKSLSLPVTKSTMHTEVVAVNGTIKSIDQNEREHIIRALRHCKGKVWGAGGAADLLQLPPSTLNSRMKKLGIRRDEI